MFLLANLQDVQNLVKFSLLLPPCSLLEDAPYLPCQQCKSQCDWLLLHFTRTMKLSKGMCTTLSSASYLFSLKALSMLKFTTEEY